MSRDGWVVTAIQAVVVVAAMVVGGVLAVNFSGGDSVPIATLATQELPTTLPVLNVTSPEDAAAAPVVTGAIEASAGVPALADVVDDVRRSVVSIMTIIEGMTQGFGGVTPFRSESEGTGTVMDVEGHILTNYHVIEDGSEVQVTFWDGTAVRAQILGSDPSNDLAIIKASIQPQRLVPARIGDSDLVRTGDSVFAIGNPFSFQFSVTSGIVSGIGRESAQNSSGRSIRGVIQIDAAVNPGNSGGPLFNRQGEVIAVNTAIHNPTQDRVFVGIGLSIPINTAMRFLDDMVAGRTIIHPQLGVSGITLSALNAADAGIDSHQGVYITGVVDGSGADTAGLRGPSRSDGGLIPSGGDAVLAIDGIALTSIQQLAYIIDLHDVGDEITLTVERNGEVIELVVTLLEWFGA
jgi:putative serine protease PepD